jgi:hypothetical protein
MTRDPFVARRAFMKERYGYRRSKAPACPRVVVGLRCRAYRPIHYGRCPCQRWHWVLDHGCAWLNKDGVHVVTGEPYGLDDAEALRGFMADMAQMGIRVSIRAESGWNPGHTVLVLLERELEPVQPR